MGNAEDSVNGKKSPAKKTDDKQVPRHKLIRGSAALSSWILIFGAGLLIETEDYRHVLAPRSVPLSSIKDKATMSLGPFVLTANIPSRASAGKQESSAIASYFAALLCYTPLNLFFLATAAGLTGGYASNIAIATMSKERRATLASEHPRRDFLLQEPPISAAFRGFVVYLFVIGGLYIVLDNPFKDSNASQYIRLAGTISIMAFLVGYDPSRIEDWLNAIPGPKPNTNAGSGGGGGGESPPKAGKKPSAKTKQGSTASDSDGNPLPKNIEEAETVNSEKEKAD